MKYPVLLILLCSSSFLLGQKGEVKDEVEDSFSNYEYATKKIKLALNLIDDCSTQSKRTILVGGFQGSVNGSVQTNAQGQTVTRTPTPDVDNDGL